MGIQVNFLVDQKYKIIYDIYVLPERAFKIYEISKTSKSRDDKSRLAISK